MANATSRDITILQQALVAKLDKIEHGMDHRLFNLLESMCERADHLAGKKVTDDIRSAFARGTDGCDVDYIAEAVAVALASQRAFDNRYHRRGKK